MGKYLDLDNVYAENPKAQQELAELRVERDALKREKAARWRHT